jgi:hypothetical protein
MSIRYERQPTPFRCTDCGSDVEFVKTYFDSWQGGEQLRSSRYECIIDPTHEAPGL